MNCVKPDLITDGNLRPKIAPRRLKGILFDKDGTLIDFQLTWGPAIHTVIVALAADDPAKLHAQAACLHFDLAARRFYPSSPLIGGDTAQFGPGWARALGRTDILALRAEIDRLTAEACLANLTPLGNPAAVLAALRARGLKTGLATNDSEMSARRQLDQLGLTATTDFIAGYDSGFGAKPAPGMIAAFARHIGAEPHEIALVGDTLHDLQAARAAGALAVAVLSGLAGADELGPHADCLLPDISALPALVERLTSQ